MSTQTTFTSSSAANVLEDACRQANLDTTGVQLMRLGENAIFALEHPSVVVRISRGMEVLNDARKEVRVADWLETCGIPAARLYHIDQPMIVREHPVTFWQRVPDSGRKASAGELGTVLRQLHDCTVPDGLQLPDFEIFGRVDKRLDRANGIPHADVEFLRGRLADLRQNYDSLVLNSAQGAVHGDAHVKNLICTPHGERVLIDFEAFARGPREIDLAVTATEYEIGWHTGEDYKDFCAAYGFDVRDWDSFPVLRDINMLKMTTWLMQNVQEGPDVRAEFTRRLETLRDPSSATKWKPF
jgi:aminoglycoside phosphotransferase (APT) family kinase protein